MIEIQLPGGHKALIDDGDAHLANWRWYGFSSKHGGAIYARRYVRIGGRKKLHIRLHHAVIGQPINGMVDHINGNPLDNRRENLRIVSCRENLSNKKARRDGETSSKYVGVSYYKRTRKWVAMIHHGTKHITIGYFKSEVDAAGAYQTAKTIIEGRTVVLTGPQLRTLVSTYR